jgi:hypothetical protein
LHDGLDHFLLDTLCTGFPLPVIEHFGKPTDNGDIGISISMFEAEKFTKFF